MVIYDKIKQYKKYDIVAAIILFAILSAIVVAFAQLLQIKVNVEQVAVISLQKIITNSRAIIPCVIAFIGSVITTPKGYLAVIRQLSDLDKYIAALNVKNDEQLEYQKCPEIIPFLLDRHALMNTISYSLLLFVGIAIVTAFGKYFSITVTDFNSRIQMVFLTIFTTAILNTVRLVLATTQLPRVMVKNYREIKYTVKQQDTK